MDIEVTKQYEELFIKEKNRNTLEYKNMIDVVKDINKVNAKLLELEIQKLPEEIREQDVERVNKVSKLASYVPTSLKKDVKNIEKLALLEEKAEFIAIEKDLNNLVNKYKDYDNFSYEEYKELKSELDDMDKLVEKLSANNKEKAINILKELKEKIKDIEENETKQIKELTSKIESLNISNAIELKESKNVLLNLKKDIDFINDSELNKIYNNKLEEINKAEEKYSDDYIKVLEETLDNVDKLLDIKDLTFDDRLELAEHLIIKIEKNVELLNKEDKIKILEDIKDIKKEAEYIRQSKEEAPLLSIQEILKLVNSKEAEDVKKGLIEAMKYNKSDVSKIDDELVSAFMKLNKEYTKLLEVSTEINRLINNK